MCGLVGFYSFTQNKKQIIKRQLKTLAHRGPDDQGVFIHDQVAFGHARLAIIDISKAKQPMASLDNRFTIVFNGEIYNYLELRQHLLSIGYKFKTHSDTEVLLNLYIEYGKKSLVMINGMFAFAIYSSFDDTIFIARDHFGIKPLYYTFVNNDFVFASEIKAILQYPGAAATPDWQSVNEYLTFQLMLKKHTLFDGVLSLEPATYMIVKCGKIVEKQSYWNIDFGVDDSLNSGQYADELLLLLENSINIQMRSDVPVGAYLSGGIDSSTVALLASKTYFGKIKTFTGGFNDSPDYDETRYAKIVSDEIHSIHNEIFPTSKDFSDCFEKLVYHMDYPEAGPGLFPQYMVSKLASEQVKVVLGGQGGDEIFGGYTRYAIAYLEQALKGAIFETNEEGSHVVTLESIIPNMSQLRNYIPLLSDQFREGFFGPMDERYFRMMNRSHNLQEIYISDFLSQMNPDDMLGKFKQVFNNPDTKSYFNKMTNFDLKTLLPALLHVEDRVSMAVSLESRVPLLDHRVVELAARMPPTMKFSGGKTKAMLHKAVRNILPEEILQRKDKMGFPTPLNEWLGGDLRDFALDIMTSKAARERGLLNTSSIETQISNSGKFNRDLWGALNLEMWFKTFID